MDRFCRSGCVIVLLAVLLLPLCGCFVTSLQPLYAPGVESFDKGLLGIWRSGDETVVFTRSDESGYDVLYRSGGNATAYRAHMVEIAKLRYLDIYPADADRKSAEAHYIPTHSIWRISLDHSQLRVRSINEEWLDSQLDSGELSIPAVHVEKDLVLLATSAELQEFIRANTDDLFPDGKESTWDRQ
jgi:hypothetical protein